MRDLWGVTRNCVGEISATGVRLLCTDPSELQLPITGANSILLLVRAGHPPHRKCMSFFWGGGGVRQRALPVSAVSPVPSAHNSQYARVAGLGTPFRSVMQGLLGGPGIDLHVSEVVRVKYKKETKQLQPPQPLRPKCSFRAV